MLGVATFGGGITLAAPQRMQEEIVVTAREPFILSDHVTVTVTNGVVRVGGLVRDLSDLLAILRLVRRVAAKARVIDEIDFEPADDDGNQPDLKSGR